MRRVFTLLGVVALAFILTAGTSAITVLMFPGKFIFNGQFEDVEEEHGILLYNDRAYVPLRHAAELLGAEVFYDHEDKQISIYQMDGRRLISEINASTAQSGYQVQITNSKEEDRDESSTYHRIFRVDHAHRFIWNRLQPNAFSL